MTNPYVTLLCAALSAAVLPVAFGQEAGGSGRPRVAEDKPGGAAADAKSPLDFTVRDIDGKEVPLARYKGEVLLIVNVASKCGYTPQYEQLQRLHEKYREQGLRVLGFPCNDFGGQEPGTNEEIRTFCTSRYGVKFDLFDKVSVKGDDACDLYRFLTSAEKVGEFGRPIKWNFTKFVVDRGGKVVARFEPKTAPDAPEVVEAIEKALKAK